MNKLGHTHVQAGLGDVYSANFKRSFPGGKADPSAPGMLTIDATVVPEGGVGGGGGGGGGSAAEAAEAEHAPLPPMAPQDAPPSPPSHAPVALLSPPPTYQPASVSLLSCSFMLTGGRHARSSTSRPAHLPRQP